MVLTGFATAGAYWFWSDLNSGNGSVVSEPSVPEIDSTAVMSFSGPAGSEQSKTETSGAMETPANAATTTAPVQQNPSESAAAALDEELKKRAAKFDTPPVTPAPAPNPVAVVKIAGPSPKPKVTTKPKMRMVDATKTSSRKTSAVTPQPISHSKPTPRNTGNWLSELKGSKQKLQ